MVGENSDVISNFVIDISLNAKTRSLARVLILQVAVKDEVTLFLLENLRATR